MTALSDNALRPALSIALCGFLGVLISLPISLAIHPALGLPLMLVFAIIGGRIGKKHGHSNGFFYFSLLCTLILLSLMSMSLGDPGLPPVP